MQPGHASIIVFFQLQSGGELENGERIANVVAGLITLCDKVDTSAFPGDKGFKKITGEEFNSIFGSDT